MIAGNVASLKVLIFTFPEIIATFIQNRTPMTSRKLVLSIIIAILLAIPTKMVVAQEKISLFDHFSKYDNVEVVIETSFRDMFKKKDEYQPAHFLVKSGSDVLLDTMGELRTRGNSRKTVCFMPPTKIRIAKSYLKSRGFATYPTLKIVNSCSYTDLAESYVQVEHMLYKIYNLFTDRSFRTKPISLNYIDTDDKKKPSSFDGFLIEHEDQLASRLHGELLALNYFPTQQLDRKTYIIFSMFEYMISNTDWKVLNKHNLEIIKVAEDRTCYPIPFDFDYSGAVNATYAIPNESLPIKSIRERIYLGPCQTPEELSESRHLFISKKEAIEQLVENSPLNDKQKTLSREFIAEFYKVIEDDKESTFVFTNCRDY
jgi:hypothetical protein